MLCKNIIFFIIKGAPPKYDDDKKQKSYRSRFWHLG